MHSQLQPRPPQHRFTSFFQKQESGLGHFHGCGTVIIVFVTYTYIHTPPLCQTTSNVMFHLIPSCF